MGALEKCVKDKQELTHKLELTELKLETSEKEKSRCEIDLDAAKKKKGKEVTVAIIAAAALVINGFFTYLGTINKAQVKDNDPKIEHLEIEKSESDKDKNQTKIFILNNYSPKVLDSLIKQ